MTAIEPTDYYPTLGLFKCKICGSTYDTKEVNAWEIHKLNHTLVALKNIIDKAVQSGDRLY